MGLTSLFDSATVKYNRICVHMLNGLWPAGEPIYGVYPSKDGREPSFPNPTANLVSTKREQLHAVQKGGVYPLRFALLCLPFFVLPVLGQHFLFFPEHCLEFKKRREEQ